MSMFDPELGSALPCWAYAGGAPDVSGVLRAAAEDFVVDEDLGFEPDGDGDHLLLHIRKRNTNTEWLARDLARYAGIDPVDVGFAGLKDRHAVTTQWFSLHLPGGAQPDWRGYDNPDVELLGSYRHRRKLRRGGLRGNAFRLQIRDLRGNVDGLVERLRRVQEEGVPNYFGEQRFGINGGNLREALAMFADRNRVRDRHKRGLYLSAARSFLFNEVLSARVAAGNWLQALPGEVLQLAGSQSFVECAVPTERIVQRIAAGELLTTGPMWGRGRPLGSGEAAALEQQVLAPYALWRDGLEHAGLEQERRALRLMVTDISWALDTTAATLTLGFWLPAGAYATTVLREVVTTAPDGDTVRSQNDR